jgi:hypothetical protein
MNFLAGDGIIFVFCTFGFCAVFFVLPILSGCIVRVEWLYFSASTI